MTISRRIARRPTGPTPVRATAEEAVEGIRSGDRVYVQGGCAVPVPIIEALVRRAPELRDVSIVHLHTEGPAPYVAPEMANHFRHNALFIGGNTRKAVNEGRADFTPVFLSDVPGLFTSGALPIDVALIQVSPPDAHGYCSLGISVDCAKPAADAAGTVIAEVNRQMPRTHGDSYIHIGDIDLLVETDRPLIEVAPARMTPELDQIGEYVATLVENRSTLQLGIGAVPDAVLRALRDHRDLGIHTEMFSDGLVDLIEQGAVTNEAKSLHQGKTVTAFVMGTRRVYDFVDDNPSVEFYPASYTNDPMVIGQNDRMVAVNSAIQVDLSGQVCADSIGHSFYSGIGGQVDFIRGASRSRGGRPIIALPSTARDGMVSRIVAELAPGAGVVTTRGDVHYVVTEYGIAQLHGKNIRERAEALVSIAHPAFRNDLLKAARAHHFVP